MSWARRRKTGYLLGVFLVIAIPVAIALFMWLYKPATCFDGVQNQTETATDRGGPCKLLDERALIPHAVLWARALPVKSGITSAVAYIENPNPEAGVGAVPYRMRLYDGQNVLVAEREGVVSVLPGRITPVYEGGMPTGERIVARAFFEFGAPLVWERYSDALQGIEVSNKRVENETTEPRVSAQVENKNPRVYENLQFIAVAFDAAGNAFAASQTTIARLEGRSRHTIVFTWPDPFTRRAARVDVLPYSAVE